MGWPDFDAARVATPTATPMAGAGRRRADGDAPRGRATRLGVVAAVLLATAGCHCRTPASTEIGGAGRTLDTPAAGASDEAAHGVVGGTGMKAYVDPATGNFTDTPPPGAPALPGDVVMPEEPVEEEPAPGGGVMIDMTGRSRPKPASPDSSQR